MDLTPLSSLALAERTDGRSTVVQALGALIEEGTISEFEALGRMGDWRARQR
jgi:hypothetical protein